MNSDNQSGQERASDVKPSTRKAYEPPYITDVTALHEFRPYIKTELEANPFGCKLSLLNIHTQRIDEYILDVDETAKLKRAFEETDAVCHGREVLTIQGREVQVDDVIAGLEHPVTGVERAPGYQATDTRIDLGEYISIYLELDTQVKISREIQ